MKRIHVPLSMARRFLLDADLLNFRGDSLVAWLIRRGGRSEYSHSAKVVWWDDDPYCCESRELKGCRAVLLETQVDAHPGQIDVFRANAQGNGKYDRFAAGKYMRRLAGQPYGYRQVIAATLSHLVTRPNMRDDVESSTPPFCSQAVAMADRVGGGVDSVPQLADGWTEPGDLVRSSFYRYLFTLEPDHEHPRVDQQTIDYLDGLAKLRVWEDAA